MNGRKTPLCDCCPATNDRFALALHNPPAFFACTANQYCLPATKPSPLRDIDVAVVVVQFTMSAVPAAVPIA
jgi:hypothetical protein